MSEFVTRRELQEKLALSPRTLDAWIARERITTFRLSGRLVRYSTAEIEAALSRAAKRAPTPASGSARRKP